MQITSPIINNIAASWGKFCTHFYLLNNNIQKSLIFYNLVINRGTGDRRPLDTKFFTQNPPINWQALTNLRANNIMANGRIQMLATIKDTGGIHLNLTTYMRLGASLNNYFSNRPT